MDNTVMSFLERNIPNLKNAFNITINSDIENSYTVTAENGAVNITADCYVSAFCGFYDYLKKYCNVQLSWCGNRTISISELTMFSGKMEKTIEQKYRVYMNYCTLDYSMCWWDFNRWEKEIDFMAMNGINMPLAVVGTEAVLYETLQKFGFTKEEALKEISGPAFWAWQLMTNIEGYLPPENENYIYERLKLGKKILNRYIEFGMYPIEQGFSGHVPLKLKEKYPKASISAKKSWCEYPSTAQLDPLDPLFAKIGGEYLNTQKRLMGNHHFIACDPFHEGQPPQRGKKYLKSVGKAINKLYEDFDSESIWIMQAWTMRKHIVKAVPKNRLIILDLNSMKTPASRNVWGYNVIAGMLHNFGGKNAMQGKLKHHCKNSYYTLKKRGAKVIGSGMFMEGIEQNPVIYDLQFELLTSNKKINCSEWIDNYIIRRYGKYNETLRRAWDILLDTCYRDKGYNENEVGSAAAARPQLTPIMTGPCCKTKVYYDTSEFEKALKLFLSVSDEFAQSDGYQYDLCDITRQAVSNRFYDNQLRFAKAYKNKDLNSVQSIAEKQLGLILCLDDITSCRSEMCLARWICDSHNLAADQREKEYFDKNARTLITMWGDINGSTALLYDYSWREWSGLIKEYYYVRWDKFYQYATDCLKNNKPLDIINADTYSKRKNYRSYDFGKELDRFEKQWINTYSEYEYPVDKNVVPTAKRCAEKLNTI